MTVDKIRQRKRIIRGNRYIEDRSYLGPHTVYGVQAIRGAKGVGYTSMDGEVDIDCLNLISLEEALYDLQDYNELGKDGYALIKDYQFILVPCLAWSERGYRVGQGGGFYDRLLQYNDDLVVMFVTLEKYKVDFIEEDHDIQADFILTERKVYAID
jgi:hypothetical protein